jgi:hypothetical protein
MATTIRLARLWVDVYRHRPPFILAVHLRPSTGRP